jgi:NADP-dependent 3-hydroxy acid dehydrogenase YdfG
MQRLSGKRVLVTGASSGIGQATARLFAQAGAAVVATGRTPEGLAALARLDAPGAIRTVVGDLTDRRFLPELVAAAAPVDILVNNAGALKHAPFLEADPADWARVFELNVQVLLELTQLVARGMVARRTGHIINISSMLARRVAPGTLVYAATKHAVAAISLGLRHELRQFNIRITEVAPGVADTSVFRAIDDAAILARYAEAKFERLTATQVAEAILFAAGTDHNACPELIEIKPVGQE